MEPLRVGLLGLGTVGCGVVRLLDQMSPQLRDRLGRPVVVVRAAVRNPLKPRSAPIPTDAITDDPLKVVDDPSVQLVVELMGGLEPARSLVLRALAAGKDVVTANKALLAEHGTELFAAARSQGRAIAFEAAVGGGIPIVQALSVGLVANRIQSLSAIVNGTCNFILTAMTRQGISYGEALRRAQELGYAEADPTLDVDGTDTAHKLAVLSQIAFGARVTTRQIPRTGIDSLDVDDIRYAGELGYAVKLLALARREGEGLSLRVAPTLVRNGTPLAEVRDAYNAIRVVGDAVGDTLFYGRGAGMMPTASAVVGDLVDVSLGRAAITERSLRLWDETTESPHLVTPAEVRSRYYLKFSIADRPGVLGTIAQVLGRHGVSIASVIQHDPGEDDGPGAPVPLVMMTHLAVEASTRAALEEIDRLDAVRPPSVCLGVLD